MFKNTNKFELTPKLSFAIAMLYMASVDETIDRDEIRYISAIMHGDMGTLSKANKYIKQAIQKNMTFYNFLEESKKLLSLQQKECIILNLIDIMFLDENISSYEEKLLKLIIKEYEFDLERYEQYKSIICIKNNHSIF